MVVVIIRSLFPFRFGGGYPIWRRVRYYADLFPCSFTFFLSRRCTSIWSGDDAFSSHHGLVSRCGCVFCLVSRSVFPLLIGVCTGRMVVAWFPSTLLVSTCRYGSEVKPCRLWLWCPFPVPARSLFNWPHCISLGACFELDLVLPSRMPSSLQRWLSWWCIRD